MQVLFPQTHILTKVTKFTRTNNQKAVSWEHEAHTVAQCCNETTVFKL